MATTRSDGSTESNGKPVLGLMSACVILIQAMVSGINLAVPSLSAGTLAPSSTELVWIVDVYVLVFAGLLLPAGAVGDRIGRRPALLAGLAVFAAGSALSALAPAVPVLLAGRAVSGAGAALVMPATLALCLQVSAPEKRGRAVGVWSGATGLGGLLGNVVAGAVLQFLAWPALFALAVPAAVVLGVLVVRWAPPPQRRPGPVDVPGSVLLVGTLVTLVFGIVEGRELGWTSPAVLGAFGAAGALGIALVLVELRRTDPLLDPRVFRVPRVAAGSIGTVAAFIGMFSLFFVNAQYLHYVHGFSPLLTGLAILPQGLCMKYVSPRASGLAERFGTRRVVGVGMGLIVLGLIGLSLADAGTPYPLYLVDLVVMATGMGLSTPVLSSGIVSSMPRERSGLGSGINSCTREIGSALGVAITGTLLVSGFSAGLPEAVAVHGDSVSAALDVAARSGPATVAVAVDSFVHAVALAYRVAAVVVAVVAVGVVVALREPRATPVGGRTG